MKKRIITVLMAISVLFSLGIINASAVENQSTIKYTICDELYAAGIRFYNTDSQSTSVDVSGDSFRVTHFVSLRDTDKNKFNGVYWFNNLEAFGVRNVGENKIDTNFAVGEAVSKLDSNNTDKSLLFDVDFAAGTNLEFIATATPVYPVTPITDPVTVGLIVPQKMSIRLEDGRIFNSGDKFTVSKSKPVKFQMCTNNWDNKTFDDNGNGIAGTVVYTFRLTGDPKGRSYNAESKTITIPVTDPVLRVDTNSFFMAYRFSFKGSTVNKGTKIEKIISIPVEYWSVNLPLGSTVTAVAYKNNEVIDQDNIFIKTGNNLADSYTDYIWNK